MIKIEDSRVKALVTEHHIENTAYTQYPGNYHGHSDEWRLDEFMQSFRATIVEYKNGRELEIDLIGMGPAIANAYRRIMIAEVPTMAIEHCFIYQNTSVIQDEMLAHRLGMIPLRVDARKFDWKPPSFEVDDVRPNFSIVFTLKALCEELPNSEPSKSGKRELLFKDYKVYSGKLRWEPMEGQEQKFKGKNVIRPVHRKILIAKLSKNQEIDIKLHAQKGIGQDHAKFSPVATVGYRLLPDIRLTSKISGEPAIRLKESFSPGVIELIAKEKAAQVVNARIDSGSRNVFRHSDLKDKVIYELRKDHYIFNIESSGCISAIDILLQSCDILESKCDYFIAELQSLRSRVNESTPMVEDI